MAKAEVPDVTETPPLSLAERVAQAQAAEAGPQQRAAELAAQFEAAVREQRFDDAPRLKDELAAAREALAIAEGTTRGLREALAAVGKLRASVAPSRRRGGSRFR